MDINTLISTFGFPIACACVCAWFVYVMYKDNKESTVKREEKLYNELAECRVVNKQALETIAQYASKLDVIQNDVEAIKTKVGA